MSILSAYLARWMVTAMASLSEVVKPLAGSDLLLLD